MLLKVDTHTQTHALSRLTLTLKPCLFSSAALALLGRIQCRVLERGAERKVRVENEYNEQVDLYEGMPGVEHKVEAVSRTKTAIRSRSSFGE